MEPFTNTETFTAYHVVTDRPMQVGQQIRFDTAHHNGVYRRVMEKRADIDEIYAHPERYDAAALEHHTSVALREFALEEVRQARYPSYPSRLACLYVSERLSDAEMWAELFLAWKRPTYHIVKLKICGNRFTGDANNCFDAVLDREQNFVMAERYWRNDPNPGGEPRIPEILANGDMEVVGIVREINQFI